MTIEKIVIFVTIKNSQHSYSGCTLGETFSAILKERN